jgi:hypothetical protein
MVQADLEIPSLSNITVLYQYFGAIQGTLWQCDSMVSMEERDR